MRTPIAVTRRHVIERDYALPLDSVQGKDRVRIRFQPATGHTAGPVFGCRVLATEPGG